MFKNKYILPASAGALSLFSLTSVHAQCPICTAAVIGGVGLARWLKIDDTITGLWIGGLIVSTILWTINWLKTKKWNFYGRDIITTIAYYAMVIIPLDYYKIIGHPLNVIWGIDKLILGTLVGSILFFAMHLKYEEIKKNNHGHAQFPFQRVVLPVGILLLASLAFYLIIKFRA